MQTSRCGTKCQYVKNNELDKTCLREIDGISGNRGKKEYIFPRFTNKNNKGEQIHNYSKYKINHCGRK